MKPCLLVLIVAPELEEPLADWLLEREDIKNFTQQEIRGFNRDHAEFSLEEQVTSRQQRVMFHVQTTETRAQALVSELRTALPSAASQVLLIPLLSPALQG
ncbi:MAG: DUF3240 family protein [Gammaproteobacteria bacterium]|jgi:hypothetical protein